MKHKESNNVLVELVDTGIMIGKEIGHDVGSTVKKFRQGKVTPMEVLTDLAHGEVRVFRMMGAFATETSRVMSGDVNALVDQRGDNPDMGWVIRASAGVLRFLTGTLDGLGVLTGWTGSALESAFSKVGIKPENKKE